MVKGVYGSYNNPGVFCSMSGRTNRANTLDLNGQFIHTIKQVTESVPIFSFGIVYDILDHIYEFLNKGGKPTLVIRDITIESTHFESISCFQLIFLLSKMCDSRCWEDDTISTELEATIDHCLGRIDELIEDQDQDIDSEEIVLMLQLVYDYDDELATNTNESATRVCLLLERFLEKDGSPASLISGQNRTLLEMVYLWEFWFGVQTDEWGKTEKSIKRRFTAIVERCIDIIDGKLRKNSVSEEEFLSLIRGSIQINQQIHGMDEEADSIDILLQKIGDQFLYFINYYNQHKVNPNLSFSEIKIRHSTYKGLACFQLVYLLWKYPGVKWNHLQEQKFQTAFSAMLGDPRIDLTLRFSEAGSLRFATELDLFEKPGYSLEEMTIAHYAVLLNDYVMLTRFLTQDPGLVSATCSMLKHEPFVGPNHHPKSSKISFGLVFSRKITRSTDVTLVHLAARAGHEGVLACLLSRYSKLTLLDSRGQAPQDYLQLSISDGVVAINHMAQTMLKAFDQKVNESCFTALPEVNKLIRREGFDLLYNTSRKVAIFAHQRLGKDSFGGVAERTLHKWVENLLIPQLNRSTDDDFKYSGFDRGHLVPAQDATGSDKEMGDTFSLENAVPQNPNLNRGIWKALEARVRNLAYKNDLIEVFTGPLFLPKPKAHSIKHQVMGKGNVHVPTHLFKIIYKYTHKVTWEVYLIPNRNVQGKQLSDYRCDKKIDFIQQHSGILFNEWVKNKFKGFEKRTNEVA